METVLIIESGYCNCKEEPMFKYINDKKVKFKMPDNVNAIKEINYFTCCKTMSKRFRSYSIDVNGDDEKQVFLCDLKISDNKNDAGIWRLGKKY